MHSIPNYNFIISGDKLSPWYVFKLIPHLHEDNIGLHIYSLKTLTDICRHDTFNNADSICFVSRTEATPGLLSLMLNHTYVGKVWWCNDQHSVQGYPLLCIKFAKNKILILKIKFHSNFWGNTRDNGQQDRVFADYSEENREIITVWKNYTKSDRL